MLAPPWMGGRTGQNTQNRSFGGSHRVTTQTTTRLAYSFTYSRSVNRQTNTYAECSPAASRGAIDIGTMRHTENQHPLRFVVNVVQDPIAATTSAE